MTRYESAGREHCWGPIPDVISQPVGSITPGVLRAGPAPATIVQRATSDSSCTALSRPCELISVVSHGWSE